MPPGCWKTVCCNSGLKWYNFKCLFLLTKLYKVVQSSYIDNWVSFLEMCQAEKSLQWCHNGGDSISNHQPHDCLLNGLFRSRSKKTWKLRVTGLCAGNSPGTGEFPAQMASNTESVSIWWHHHVWLPPLGFSERKAVRYTKYIPYDRQRVWLCFALMWLHDDVIKWEHFLRYWPFECGIHQWLVNSSQKGPVTKSVEFFFDLCLKKTVEWTNEMQLIWDAIMLIMMSSL